MTPAEQLELWVNGNSVHNHERTIILEDKDGSEKVIQMEGGECCPDFSCCKPQLQWPEETRFRFYKARLEGDTDTTDRMLGMALGAAIELATNGKGTKVHVVDTDRHNNQETH